MTEGLENDLLIENTKRGLTLVMMTDARTIKRSTSVRRVATLGMTIDQRSAMIGNDLPRRESP